jgi:cytosine/adenosine deaminase-related metal-dependent hydrolase|tara:strand:+ start:3513 stop:4700 length:1188 start_codon:yes stop_codon:yes gene_type:complete
MILKNVSLLYGHDLKLIDSINIEIAESKFKKISLQVNTKNQNVVDCNGLLLIPGFINAHTHIGDSIAKDLSLNSTVDSKIHPMIGIKQKILRETPDKELIRFMRKSAQTMLKKGITTFVDFREGGIHGINLLKKALKTVPINPVILGRLEYYHTQKQIKQNTSMPDFLKSNLESLIENCDGVGISGPNENSDNNLQEFSKIKKIVGIHAAETLSSYAISKKSYKKTEPKRALLAEPTFLVHMTNASKNDLLSATKKTRGIIICPRANASLAEGIPDIELMLKMKCNIGIGTDNVMINSPDMFREMDYVWKVTMGIKKKRIDPKQILKMATVNSGKILNKKIGCIKENYFADCIFIDKKSIDLEPVNNVYASIVHRASQESIRAVMSRGKIVYGKI